MNRQELVGNFVFEALSDDRIQGDQVIAMAEALGRATEFMGENQDKFTRGVAKIVMQRGLDLIKVDEEND